jgi:hypothetical protein
MGNPLRLYNSRRAFAFTLLLIINFQCFSALAAPIGKPETFEAAVTLKGYYEFKCNGVRFGKMGIELEQSKADYTMTSDITTTGVLKFFVPHKSHTTVSGSGKDFAYPDVEYESDYQTRKKKKYVKIIYKDAVPSETLVPPESPDKRPPIAEELKTGSVDPLSFLLHLREGVHKAQLSGAKSFSIKHFDGRRLTMVTMTMEGSATIPYGDGTRDTIRIGMTRKLLGGHTKSEIEDFEGGEPVIYAYLSDDSRLIPLLLQTDLWYGTLTAELVKECRTGESCLLAIK